MVAEEEPEEAAHDDAPDEPVVVTFTPEGGAEVTSPDFTEDFPVAYQRLVRFAASFAPSIPRGSSTRGLEGAAVEGPASGSGQVDDLQGSLGTDAEIETEPAGPGTAPRTIDDRDEAKELQTRHGYGPADGATFKALRVSALDKANELDGVERNDFSSLSQEEWEHLPMLLELHFEFIPTQGNTRDLEDTFLLTPADMSVLVGGRSFASIGTISEHGEPELHQRMPLNVAGEEYPDGRLDYCGMGCPQSTMWFLVPEGTEEIELVYRETPIAAGKAE